MVRGVETGRRLIAAGACALALAAGLGGCSFSVPTLSETSTEQTVDQQVDDSALVENGVLTVGLNTSDAPQAMTDANGNLTGYNVDVAYALGQRLGLKVKLVEAASAKDALSDGKADIFIGMPTSRSVAGVTVVGETLGDAPALFTVSADGANNSPAVSAEDLSGATIGVQASSASTDALARAGISAAQRTYNNVNECLEALEKGEVEYVACDAVAGSYVARAYRDISFVGIVGSQTSYGIAAAHRNTTLLEELRSELEAMNQDGTLDALHVLWYGDMPVSLENAALPGVTIAAVSDENDDADGDDASQNGAATDSDSNGTDDNGDGDSNDADGDEDGATAGSDNSVPNSPLGDVNSLSN